MGMKHRLYKEQAGPMDEIFLIEIRLCRTKWRIRELVSSIARAFRIEEFMERHPHVTLYGPFSLKEGTNSRDLLKIIGTIAADFDPVLFSLNGFEKRDGMHGSVLACSVHPSKSLRELNARIDSSLFPLVTSMNAWDGQPEKKWFHSTIANRLDSRTATRVFSSLTGSGPTPVELVTPAPGILNALRNLIVPGNKPDPVPVFPAPLLDDTGLRITILLGEHIFAEYDLLEKRWILTGHDHAGLSWQHTLLSFRHQVGFEMKDPGPVHPETLFVISDLHLGHANIIRYCSRPFLFSDVQEMDHVLVKNWNYSISQNDRIFHLGDLRYGKDSRPLQHYRKKLHGNITFIAGNHDEEELGAVSFVPLEYDGRQFLLIHDPASAPASFDGWVIHGHYHNNDLRAYPFMNFKDRRINVSAEVVGYRPVRLEELSCLIHEREISGDTTPILLRYPHVI
jgi:calcineurin-like phosphoesterase family protein